MNTCIYIYIYIGKMYVHFLAGIYRTRIPRH